MLSKLDNEIQYIEKLKKKASIDNKALGQLNNEITKLKNLKVSCLCKLITYYDKQAIDNKKKGVGRLPSVTYGSEQALGVGTKTINALFTKAMYIISFALSKRLDKLDMVYVEYKGEAGYGYIKGGTKL